MKPLENIGAGLNDIAQESQTVFTACLKAISYPGTLREVQAHAECPSQVKQASALLLLSLLDSDCTVWLSESQQHAAQWLQFHTGCRFVEEAQEADFVWIGLPSELSVLEQCALGTDEQPEQSAWCVIDVEGLQEKSEPQATWKLVGPGIASAQYVDIAGWTADQQSYMASIWQQNRALFPRGLDFFLCTSEVVMAVPRTTEITLVYKG